MFFENESNQSLRNDLIDLAKKQVSFEDIEKTDLLRLKISRNIRLMSR